MAKIVYTLVDHRIARLTYSVRETCEILGISRSRCFGLVKEGTLKTTKLGSRTLAPRRSLDDLVSA